MRPTILALIGKPLAGKDTQADLLVAAHPEAVKISTGHILRAVAEEGETHRFWPIVGPYLPMLDQGLKLPDGPVIAMLRQAMQEQVNEGKKLLVIAGSPRSFDQLDGFEQIAEDIGAELLIAHVDVTDDETRLRRGFRNEGRVDDDPAIHEVRLEEYQKHVLPVAEKLRSEGRLIEVNGMPHIESVFRTMENALRQHLLDPEITLPFMARR